PRPFFGAGRDDERFGNEDRLLAADGGPQPITQAQFHAISLIDPAMGTESIRREIALEPGRTLAVTVLGPDGEALAGAQVQERAENGWGPPREAATFEVTGLNPARPRDVVVKHEPRRLIGMLVARGDETGPATLRLRPWGTATGRLV